MFQTGIHPLHNKAWQSFVAEAAPQNRTALSFSTQRIVTATYGRGSTTRQDCSEPGVAHTHQATFAACEQHHCYAPQKHKH